MKILLINKFHYMRGGSETYYFALAEALQAKGHTVIFFSMEDEKNLPCEQAKYFVSNVNYNKDMRLGEKISKTFKLIYSFEAKHNIEKLIAEEKPDIAHIGLLHRQLTFSVVDALKRNNIPVVMTMHDLIFTCPNYTMLSHGVVCEKCVGRSTLPCIKNKCVKESYPKSILASLEAGFLKMGNFYDKIDLYITECKFYESIMRRSHVTKSRVITMSNFLPMDQRYVFSKNYENYILYFGRFSQEKGILTLLKAHKHLKCKYKLMIVGAGPIESDLKQYVSTNNLNNIAFPGAIYGTKMDEIIDHARTVIIPSEWNENCPYALLQSIARGKVVIASRIGGLPELIEDRKTGFLFEAGDADDLARQIDTVMNMDKNTYESLSEFIARRAEENHHWENYIEALLDEYESLIEKQRSHT